MEACRSSHEWSKCKDSSLQGLKQAKRAWNPNWFVAKLESEGFLKTNSVLIASAKRAAHHKNQPYVKHWDRMFSFLTWSTWLALLERRLTSNQSFLTESTTSDTLGGNLFSPRSILLNCILKLFQITEIVYSKLLLYFLSAYNEYHWRGKLGVSGNGHMSPSRKITEMSLFWLSSLCLRSIPLAAAMTLTI